MTLTHRISLAQYQVSLLRIHRHIRLAIFMSDGIAYNN